MKKHGPQQPTTAQGLQRSSQLSSAADKRSPQTGKDSLYNLAGGRRVRSHMPAPWPGVSLKKKEKRGLCQTPDSLVAIRPFPRQTF